MFAPNPLNRLVASKAAYFSANDTDESEPAERDPSRWMAKLQQVFDIEISVPRRGGGQRQVIGELTEINVIERIMNTCADIHRSLNTVPFSRGLWRVVE